MKTIGIDQNNSLVYEGTGYWGYGLWPTPALLPTTIINTGSENFSSLVSNDLSLLPYIFVDEGYDPTSRVRKGRIFERIETQPFNWHVYPHPAIPAEYSSAPNKASSKLLVTFRQFNFFTKLQQDGITDPLLIIGSQSHYTIWSVVDAETAISGETILFIKSRKVIGALPKIDYGLIKETDKLKLIQEKIDLLARDISGAGPDSVVDRCREAASSVINTYLIQNGLLDKEKDLGQLENPLRTKGEKHIVANLAGTLAKFHSRTKFTEQSKRKTRGVSEQDAEFAIKAIGIILIELGWGYW